MTAAGTLKRIAEAISERCDDGLCREHREAIIDAMIGALKVAAEIAKAEKERRHSATSGWDSADTIESDILAEAEALKK